VRDLTVHLGDHAGAEVLLRGEAFRVKAKGMGGRRCWRLAAPRCRSLGPTSTAATSYAALHQIDESRSAVAGIAAVVALLRMGVAGTGDATIASTLDQEDPSRGAGTAPQSNESSSATSNTSAQPSTSQSI
jgi:hypothetical protein